MRWLILLFWGVTSWAQSPQYIDIHCHVGCIGAGDSGCYVSDEFAKSFKFKMFQKAMGLKISDLEKNGDAWAVQKLSQDIKNSKYVKKLVLLALDGVIKDGVLDKTQTQLYIPNEFLAKEVKKYDNLLWGASINPYRPDALERLQWAVEHGAVLGRL
ncbi:MAG: hypothetical protein WCG27_12460 [Pseudomonadota bacterium]